MKVLSVSDDLPIFSVDDKKNVDLKKTTNCTPVARISPFTTKPSVDCFNVIMKLPWTKELPPSLCHATAPIQSLENLMQLYNEEVYKSVVECYTKPNRAAHLMKSMSNTLMFFHMIYTDLKLPLVPSTYLKKMSDLMAMYLDMEIKAFSKTQENPATVASRITSSFHIYFGKSQDCVVDTIIKSKFIQAYRHTLYGWKLYDLIFQRLLRDFSGTSPDFISYFRYLLLFRLWIKILEGDPLKRTKAVELACMKLHPPSDFEYLCNNSELQGIIPRTLPKTGKSITEFFITAKLPTKMRVKWFLGVLEDPKLKYLLSYSSGGSNDFLIKQSFDTLMVHMLLKYKSIDSKPKNNKKRSNKLARSNLAKENLKSSLSEVIVINDESDTESSSTQKCNDIIERPCVKVKDEETACKVENIQKEIDLETKETHINAEKTSESNNNNDIGNATILDIQLESKNIEDWDDWDEFFKNYKETVTFSMEPLEPAEKFFSISDNQTPLLSNPTLTVSGKRKVCCDRDEGPKAKSPRNTVRNEKLSSVKGLRSQNKQKPQMTSFSLGDLDGLEELDTWINSPS